MHWSLVHSLLELDWLKRPDCALAIHSFCCTANMTSENHIVQKAKLIGNYCAGSCITLYSIHVSFSADLDCIAAL